MTIRVPSAPDSWAYLVKLIASSVELDPVPAITGTLLFAASIHKSIILSCSSWFKVGDSPVVPEGTSPWVPWFICHSTKSWKDFSSISPFLNGVINAVIDPLKIKN